jgi:hypothetical protein
MTRIDRRQLLGWLASPLLAACGGGGGGGDSSSTAAPTGVATDTSQPVPQLSRNIALWGDSLVPPVALNLRQMIADRSIFDGGVVGENSMQIAARELADTEHESWINVFWYGHNNQTQSAQIEADLAASVSRLARGNTHFIVMSVVNQATPQESRGAPDYQVIMAMNQVLAATYPSNFLDIRSVLVNSYNPADGQDQADFANDVPPQSLRFDHIHLNNDGSIVVATEIKKFIEARGW